MSSLPSPSNMNWGASRILRKGAPLPGLLEEGTLWIAWSSHGEPQEVSEGEWTRR